MNKILVEIPFCSYSTMQASSFIIIKRHSACWKVTSEVQWPVNATLLEQKRAKQKVHQNTNEVRESEAQ